MKKTALILAAGEGSRMKSKTPKVLHKMCGKAMIAHVLDAAKGAGVEKNIVVIGKGADLVKKSIESETVTTVLQEERLGTGHAVMCAVEELPESGQVMVLCGDTPLITGESLDAFMEYHIKEENVVSVLTAVYDNPKGYGRIVKDEQNRLLKIVEEKDADEATKAIKEINSGMYCFDAEFLKENVVKLTNNNAAGEYYITDLIGMAVEQNRKTGSFSVNDSREIMGVNNRVQLAEAEAVKREKICIYHMEKGVTIIDPKSTYIEDGVEIGADTVVYPGVILTGKTVIGSDCLIGHNSRIQDSVIGDGTEIQNSTIVESKVGNDTTVGPCAYLRPKSDVGNGCKIGDFVEVKNARIGDGSKASHLAYIGDADIGERVNIGCGVVFVNYDGINKFRSIVKDDAFIGSNSNLVAPVVVEEKGYIAAGTTITRPVEAGALVVGRPKERVLQGWGERKLNEKKEKKNGK